MSYETAADHVSFQTIRSASTPELLRSARLEEQLSLFGRFSSTKIEEWNRNAGELQDAVMSQAAILCQRQLIEEGFGSPPAAYAFVAYGSAGRNEQTLWSDQDNGLIIGKGDGPEVKAYFDRFGVRLSQLLEQAGYPPCPGNVMTSNPLWRKSTEDWIRQLESWREQLGWEQVRYLMIAADMRHISGDSKLTGELRRTTHEIFEQDSGPEGNLAAAVLRNTIRHKAALNVLGQVITEQTGDHAGDFDVKYGLYLPLVNAVRYLAVEYGISASSTQERLARLIKLEVAPYRWLESCQNAFYTALRFRSMTSYLEEDGTLSETGYLPQSMLKQKEIRRELREALGTVKLMYRTLQRQQRYAERKWL
ncbi:DUF294 nucleotidyltransferase-like domain-containing protein [Paenibacillus vini]|uniref:Signal transduction protein n=1 Tax=Paenibacillus vini TaxID=1476024 RepID=A0ABQ4MB18_9BACL|nr:DUF294 nucleotidyltransferase-like domain-containing protein [Paenibacillus vini]GIP53167.1 hypothetical protein J42TS3_22020 [Paenibacillus vini]